MSANISEILEISRKYGLYLFEDSAQSHGVSHHGNPTASLSDGAVFSFYPTKNLGALGDGGMVVSNNLQLIEGVKLLRNYGSREKYFNLVKGHNSRLDEIQAAFLIAKLPNLASDNASRIENASKYDELIQNTGVIKPKIYKDFSHVYHLYTVRTKKRNELKDFLATNGIETLIHYPVAPHLQEAYSNLEYKYGDFPIAESIQNEILSLPLWPNMDKKIIAKSKELAKKAGAGVKRFANIPKKLAEKALIRALEKNLMGLSSRLKNAYNKTPNDVKNLLKPMGEWEKLKAAINKGDKKAPSIIGEYKTRTEGRVRKTPRMSRSLRGMPMKPMRPIKEQGETNEFFAQRLNNYSKRNNKYKELLKDYLNKGKLSGDEDGAGAGGEAEATAEAVKQGVGLIKKIIEFFKKRKEGKAGDDELIEGMGNSVDADPNIDKTDENGKVLPVPQEAKDIDKIDKEGAEEKGGGLMDNKALLIGGALALAVGGYFIIKKK